MTMLSHYIDIRCLSHDGLETTQSDIAFAMSRMLKVVHSLNAKGKNVAIDLPGMLAGGRKPSLGTVFRIFGNEGSLAEFIQHDAIKGLSIADGIKTDGIRAVPHGHGWGACIRDRGSDRNRLGWIARSQRRLERRARERGDDERKMAALKERHSKLSARANLGRTPLPFVNVTSRSTGQKFTIHVRREIVDGGSVGKFDSYGLSAVGQGGRPSGCIPVF